MQTNWPKLSRRRLPLAMGLVLNACRQSDQALAEDRIDTSFHTPEDVRITGYTGDAMEPFLSREGRYLLFNNRNEAPANTNLHWSERVDDLTFSYRGEISGVNTAALEGVPSLDNEHNLYFISTRSYAQTWSTIYRARFNDGIATAPELVEGLSRHKPGWVNFDAEISADGHTLYFVDGYFGRKSAPQNAKLVVAVRSASGFRRADQRLFVNVNSHWLQYAPSVSTNELELFFTRVKRIEPAAKPAIYFAVRKTLHEPFSKPMRIGAIQGFAEASTLSPDGRSLYYHALAGASFRIKRVTR